MKPTLFAILALVFMFVLSVFASQATITGVLTDNLCTRKHMMPGKPNADCVRECVKHGAKYAVVADGKVMELTGNQEQFSAQANQQFSAYEKMK